MAPSSPALLLPTPLPPALPPPAHLEVGQQPVAPPVARHHGVVGVVPGGGWVGRRGEGRGGVRWMAAGVGRGAMVSSGRYPGGWVILDGSQGCRRSKAGQAGAEGWARSQPWVAALGAWTATTPPARPPTPGAPGGRAPAEARLLALRGRVGDEGGAEGGRGRGPAREGQHVRHVGDDGLRLLRRAARRQLGRPLLLARRLHGGHHRRAQPLCQAAEGQALRVGGRGEGGGMGSRGAGWAGLAGWRGGCRAECERAGGRDAGRDCWGWGSLEPAWSGGRCGRSGSGIQPAACKCRRWQTPGLPAPPRTSNGSTPCSGAACGCAAYCGRGSARAFLVGMEMLAPTCILKLCGRGLERLEGGRGGRGPGMVCRAGPGGRAGAGVQGRVGAGGMQGARRAQAGRGRRPHLGGRGVRGGVLCTLLAGGGRLAGGGQRHALERRGLGLRGGELRGVSGSVSGRTAAGLMACRGPLARAPGTAPRPTVVPQSGGGAPAPHARAMLSPAGRAALRATEQAMMVFVGSQGPLWSEQQRQTGRADAASGLLIQNLAAPGPPAAVRPAFRPPAHAPNAISAAAAMLGQLFLRNHGKLAVAGFLGGCAYGFVHTMNTGHAPWGLYGSGEPERRAWRPGAPALSLV